MKTAIFIVTGILLGSGLLTGGQELYKWYNSEERKTQEALCDMAYFIMPSDPKSTGEYYINDKKAIVSFWTYDGCSSKEGKCDHNRLSLEVEGVIFQSYDFKYYSSLEKIFTNGICFTEDNLSKEEWEEYQQLFVGMIKQIHLQKMHILQVKKDELKHLKLLNLPESQS
jgi:hypothetical protein